MSSSPEGRASPRRGAAKPAADARREQAEGHAKEERGDPAGPQAANASRGERVHNANQLLSTCYEELRRCAGAQVRKLPPWQTFQRTELLHEAYLKLVERADPERRQWGDRRALILDMARAMHDILVDRARRHDCAVRGRQAVARRLEGSVDAPSGPDVERLDRALQHLQVRLPGRYEIAMLRFYAGFTNAQIAEHLVLSERTVERSWRQAREFLARELGGASERSADG